MRKRSIVYVLVICLVCSVFFGCNRQTFAQKEDYKGRVFYEIFVRAFNDSNGDGIGDLKGVTQKLDYLKNMGIKGIWLMPINSSPSYHGYDVSDYYSINKDYGTMEDFKQLIKEAHKRGIMVIMDLVINHTSTENSWFREASQDKNSKYRNYYLWSSDSNVENETSPISSQPWTKLGNEYYYSLFWSGMPDLNYDDKDVRDEVKKIAKTYLDDGVDGFRLDAAKWIYNETDKNTAWWQEFNSYIKSINKNAVLVGEVWDNQNEIINYEGYLDSCFDFPAADLIMNSVASSSMSGLGSGLQNIFDAYTSKNSSYVTSPFLTNHDMDRVMSKLNDTEQAKGAAAVLLTLPGTPYIYYGEETGMTGAKPDEQIRQPFVWDNKDKSKNSSWEPIQNDIDKIAVSVQEKDKNSLLNFYKTLIALRNNSDALKYGDFKAVAVENNSVGAYKREYKGKTVYVYINMDKNSAVENTDISSAKVLYSNKRTDKKVKFSGKIELKPMEIMLLEK